MALHPPLSPRLPNEAPFPSFPAPPPPNRSSPKLLRMLSSKPGRLARCFLNGLPTIASGAMSAGSADEGCAAGVAPLGREAEAVLLGAGALVGAGVPEMGLLEAGDLRALGEGALRGSAECWRFSWEMVSCLLIRG